MNKIINVQGDIKRHKLHKIKKEKEPGLLKLAKENRIFNYQKTFDLNYFIDCNPSKKHLDPTFFLTISTNTAPKHQQKETNIH